MPFCFALPLLPLIIGSGGLAQRVIFTLVSLIQNAYLKRWWSQARREGGVGGEPSPGPEQNRPRKWPKMVDNYYYAYFFQIRGGAQNFEFPQGPANLSPGLGGALPDLDVNDNFVMQTKPFVILTTCFANDRIPLHAC